MGGFGALLHAMKHVELFGSVVAYAPALLEVQKLPGGGLTLRRGGGTHAGASPESPALMAKNKLLFERMLAAGPRSSRSRAHRPSCDRMPRRCAPGCRCPS